MTSRSKWYRPVRRQPGWRSSNSAADPVDSTSNPPVRFRPDSLPTPLMTRRISVWLLAFSIVGLAASAMASIVHYRLLRDPGYASFCDINETWSCATVYESRYGAFRGVPVAVGGLIWFSAATLLVLAGGPPRQPP